LITRVLFWSASKKRLAGLAKAVTIAYPESIVIIKYRDLLTGPNFPQRSHFDPLR
jgi:hypothetical protein